MEMMYSEKEYALIEHYFPDLPQEAIDNIPAISLYRMMVDEAFVRNEGGIFEESLRRCMIAITKIEPYRLTPEWEALIDDRVLDHLTPEWKALIDVTSGGGRYDLV